jgi:putative membrane protein
MENTFGLILNSLQTGLPLLLLDFVVTLLLLVLGILVYERVTPFNDRQLIASGNAAAGTVLGGTIVAFAIPLAATLATSRAVLDILVWGIVAVILQLLTFLIAMMFVKRLRGMIEAGNVAAALILVGIQMAIALLNAGAMAG